MFVKPRNSRVVVLVKAMPNPSRKYGELLRRRDRRRVGKARALLFPIDWPEPFGLVMIEAMSAGTPVIGETAPFRK